MLEKLVNLFNKYRTPVLYLFFGGVTTLVNIAAYYLVARIFGIDPIPATLIAWLISVLAAYLTNRKWVFDSHAASARDVLRELSAFLGARVFTGLLDLGMMYLFVKKLYFDDMLIKIVSNVIVIVLNYVFSKFLIFKRQP